MSDATFGTWTAAASPLQIEYSLVVIEEIRHEVAEGFQKLSRGGIEVGGLLYGIHDGKSVRIMAIRPAACEHAAGPTFRLSERDRAALHEQIRENQTDARLEDLVCVGWYVSHTRTEIVLSESDQEIFSSFFAKPWQVTLVVRPSRGGNMRAGFFVWEADGTVNPNQSYLEFSFPDRLAPAFENRGSFAERQSADQRSAARAARPAFVPSAPPPAASPIPAAPAQDGSASPQTRASAPSNMTSLFADPSPVKDAARSSEWEPEYPLRGSSKTNSGKKWLVLSAALVVIGGLGVTGARVFMAGEKNESISLSVLEREGQLDIEWNRQSAPIANAVSGTLEIADGPQTQTIPLKPRDLAQGKFAYKRGTGDIQVRMMLNEPDGKKVQEASRFLGPPPVKANDDELKTLQQRRDDLETEVARLKQLNSQQAERIQQLERTLKILQTRQGN
jgi:proteasome lid subunit RPN8/RPN11